MPRFHTIDDLDVAGKRVLLRADLNVPVKDGKVTDATRIERLAPTIETLVARKAMVVVMSHFGRPKGPDTENSLRQLVEPLSRAIGGEAVHFASDCIGPRGREGRYRAETGRGGAAGKPALPSRRGKKRSGVRKAARGAWRSLYRRRVFGGASRACLDRGARPSVAERGREADAGRAGGARRRARTSGASGDGADRRRRRSRPNSTC